jgi:hypothetical protein
MHMPVGALFGIAAFSAFSFFLGWRVLRLARRSGGLPERALGIAFLFSGGIAPLLQAPPLMEVGPVAVQRACFAGVRLGIDLGIGCQMLFTWQVFRRESAWARRLFACAVASLAILYAAYAASGVLGDHRYRGVWFWLEVPLHVSGLVWGAAEALRYHRLMRRRLALGLADPIVADRFLLWGVAVGASAVSLAIPPLVELSPSEAALRPWIAPMAAGPAFVSIAAYALTFFPPAAYRRRLLRRAAREAA